MSTLNLPLRLCLKGTLAEQPRPRGNHCPCGSVFKAPLAEQPRPRGTHCPCGSVFKAPAPYGLLSYTHFCLAPPLFHLTQTISFSGDWDGFYETVEAVARTAVQAPQKCPLDFEFTIDAANHNSSLLEEVGYDLSKFIDQHPSSTISYGSELRPLSHLEPLLHHHPLYDQFAKNHVHGIDYPLNDIEDEKRIENVKATIERGNHKAALEDEQRPHVTKGMLSDVQYGYGIPIPVDTILKIPGAEVYPINVQNQTTIDESGNIIPKKRVTHDLSHNRGSGESINQRVRDEELPEVIFGFALLRFLHLIHWLRWLHPNERILCNKIDIEKAYRRLHVKASIAVKSIAIWFLDKMWEGGYQKSEDQIAVMLTRLPFGSSPAPAEFCVTSETVFDLSNDLLYCEKWDPSILPSPYANLLPEPTRLSEDIPFGKAEEGDVKLDQDCKGGADGYIDDGACAVLDSADNWRMVRRAREAVGMALFLVFRPLAGLFEPIPRPDAASIRKLKAEGTLVELIIFLGWLIDTRRFTIALPIDKWKAWRSNIIILRDKRIVSYSELSSLIGRLNHVCFIIPDARHFMNNLRRMESIAKRNRGRKVKLSATTIEDINLWIEFLDSAKDGISINRIIFRKPTLITYSDSSEQGIGGYSPFTGIGWRYRFKEEEAKAFTLNCKEYIASAIDLAIQAEHDPNDCPFPCYLNRSDSTSTVGWLRKSNHDPDERPIHNEIARFHARDIMSHDACNYSQHLPGKENVVTDSLSRDFHFSNEQIIAMLTSLHPNLSTSQITIIDLPQKHISWISSLAQKWPGQRELPKRLIPSEIAAGITGWDFAEGSNSAMTPIWNPSTHLENYASAVLSCMQCEEVTLGKSQSKETLPERPLTMWQRPSWRVVGSAP